MTRRKIAALIAFDLAAILIVAGLVALATWQFHRRVWKLDLIARVEARVHAAPIAAPGPDRWRDISAATDEYRHVIATGRWQTAASTLVQAATERGAGYWVLTPLLRDDGTTVLVNRGFVPADKKAPEFWEPSNAEPVTVTGLLRITEPNGAFLRSNDPVADRWFSRDVSAIAAARRLSTVAPYFIDADRAPDRAGLPIAGLTVISFANNHLVYAITWAVLAVMVVAGAIFVNGEALRSRKAHLALD